MNNLVERELHVIEYIEFQQYYAHPELISVQLDKAVKPKPIDLGALCYANREELINGRDTGSTIKARKVELDSLLKNRRPLINNLLNNLYTSGYRQTTIKASLQCFINTIDWLDSNGCSDFLDYREKTVDCYITYSDYLYEKILKGDFTQNTASQKQRTLHTIISCFYTDIKVQREIFSSAPTIPEVKDPVKAPSKYDIDSYLGVLVPFIRNLGKALMSGQGFPIGVNCGEYDVYLLASNNSNIDSPFVEAAGIWNSDAKRYKTFKEYMTPPSKYKCKSDYEKRKTIVKEYRELYTNLWCQKVINGYGRIFEFLTGGYSSEIIALNYDNAIEVVKDQAKKELVTVKFRANGAEISYTIHRKGLLLLREYIKFRNWYLDGSESDLLFFNLCQVGTLVKLDTPSRLRADYGGRHHKQLSGRVIDPIIKNLTPRKSRKFKSNILKFLGYSPKETANALQHTETTNLISYSTNNEENMANELGQFWSSVKINVKNIPITDSKETTSKNITVGRCSDYGSPHEMTPSPPLEPNCLQPHGCLFCDKYMVHADEDDIRKVCSLRYVVDAARESIDDFKAADEVFRELSVRAEFVLQEMVSQYPDIEETVIEVKRQVFKCGVLTPFWEERLSRYEELGVIV